VRLSRTALGDDAPGWISPCSHGEVDGILYLSRDSGSCFYRRETAQVSGFKGISWSKGCAGGGSCSNGFHFLAYKDITKIIDSAYSVAKPAHIVRVILSLDNLQDLATYAGRMKVPNGKQIVWCCISFHATHGHYDTGKLKWRRHFYVGCSEGRLS